LDSGVRIVVERRFLDVIEDAAMHGDVTMTYEPWQLVGPGSWDLVRMP